MGKCEQNVATCAHLKQMIWQTVGDVWPFCENPGCPDPVWKPVRIYRVAAKGLRPRAPLTRFHRERGAEAFFAESPRRPKIRRPQEGNPPIGILTSKGRRPTACGGEPVGPSAPSRSATVPEPAPEESSGVAQMSEVREQGRRTTGYSVKT